MDLKKLIFEENFRSENINFMILQLKERNFFYKSIIYDMFICKKKKFMCSFPLPRCSQPEKVRLLTE